MKHVSKPRKMPYTALNSVILLYLIDFKKKKQVCPEWILHSRLRQRPFFAGRTAWVENPEAPQLLTVDG